MIFQDELGKILLKNEVLRLLVFDEIEEVIVEWVPHSKARWQRCKIL